jgi:DNA modification methylase
MSAVVEEIMIPFHQTDRFTLYEGDCRIVLRDLSDCSVDSIVCDPPYELGFMGKGWDRSGIAYDVSVWRECLRVLKPGGHLLAFGGSRTYHRLACAIEDAGFEIRDQIQWIYSQGFPKSLSVSASIDRAEYERREAAIRSALAAKGFEVVVWSSDHE